MGPKEKKKTVTKKKKKIVIKRKPSMGVNKANKKMKTNGNAHLDEIVQNCVDKLREVSKKPAEETPAQKTVRLTRMESALKKLNKMKAPAKRQRRQMHEKQVRLSKKKKAMQIDN